jgi:hypothetical protein
MDVLDQMDFESFAHEAQVMDLLGEHIKECEEQLSKQGAFLCGIVHGDHP